MKKAYFISPIVLTVIFFVITIIWCSIYIHVSAHSSHFHFVEKIMFSGYFTALVFGTLFMGAGLLSMVFSVVLSGVQKLFGVEINKKAGDGHAV